MTPALGNSLTFHSDRLKDENYFDRRPLLEFFRHVRNAVSHGNAFNFVGKEPTRPAVFRSFTLSRADQGATLFFDYLLTGDAMDLLDDTERCLRGLP